MCLMQGTSNKAAIVEFGSLPMRVGVAGAGARPEWQESEWHEQLLEEHG